MDAKKSFLQISYTEYEFMAARSSGAGGQSVNRTNSKVILRWNLFKTQSLTSEQIERVAIKIKHMLTSEGDLLVSSQDQKSQDMNKKQCIQKIEMIVIDALKVPKKRIPTKVKKSAKVKRLNSKNKDGEKKSLRQKIKW